MSGRPRVYMGIDFGTTNMEIYNKVLGGDGRELLSEKFSGYPGAERHKRIPTLQHWPIVDGKHLFRWGVKVDDAYHGGEGDMKESEVLRRIKLACHEPSMDVGRRHRAKLLSQLEALGITLEEALGAWFRDVYRLVFRYLEARKDLLGPGGLNEAEINVAVAIPADWQKPEEELIRRSATQDIVTHDKIEIAYEPDALVIAYLSSEKRRRPADFRENAVLVVDGGGGTTCINCTKVAQTSPMRFEEVVASASLDTGSEMLTEKVCILAEDHLRSSGDTPKERLHLGVKMVRAKFERWCKPYFGGDDGADEFDIEKSLDSREPVVFHLSFMELCKIFDGLIDRNMEKVHEFVKRSSVPIGLVILAGGLHQSPYVRKKMKEALKKVLPEVEVIILPMQKSKISKGLTLGYGEDIWIRRYNKYNRGLWADLDYTPEVAARFPNIRTLPDPRNPGKRLFKAIFWFVTKGETTLTDELTCLDDKSRYRTKNEDDNFILNQITSKRWNTLSDGEPLEEYLIHSTEDLKGRLVTICTDAHESGNADGSLKTITGENARIYRSVLEWAMDRQPRTPGRPAQCVPPSSFTSVIEDGERKKRVPYEVHAEGTNAGAKFIARVFSEQGRKNTWDLEAIEAPFNDSRSHPAAVSRGRAVEGEESNVDNEEAMRSRQASMQNSRETTLRGIMDEGTGARQDDVENPHDWIDEFLNNNTLETSQGGVEEPDAHPRGQRAWRGRRAVSRAPRDESPSSAQAPIDDTSDLDQSSQSQLQKRKRPISSESDDEFQPSPNREFENELSRGNFPQTRSQGGGEEGGFISRAQSIPW